MTDIILALGTIILGMAGIRLNNRVRESERTMSLLRRNDDTIRREINETQEMIGSCHSGLRTLDLVCRELSDAVTKLEKEALREP